MGGLIHKKNVSCNQFSLSWGPSQILHLLSAGGHRSRLSVCQAQQKGKQILRRKCCTALQRPFEQCKKKQTIRYCGLKHVASLINIRSKARPPPPFKATLIVFRKPRLSSFLPETDNAAYCSAVILHGCTRFSSWYILAFSSPQTTKMVKKIASSCYLFIHLKSLVNGKV